MRSSRLRIALVALAGCAAGASSATDDAGVDAGADVAKTCSRDARPLPRFDYVPTKRVEGACTDAEVFAFGAACATDPSSKKCALFLASSPPCARCLLGDALPGPLRRGSDHITELSPGTCGQALAGEVYDAGADAAPVGGCGQTMENVGKCVSYACGACDAGDLGCRVAAYIGPCSEIDRNLARCDAVGAAHCVLGSAADRARAIAAAVCGGDAGPP